MLVDSAGEPRAVLRVKEDDSVCLDLADDTGRTRAMLGVLLDGTPGVYLYDAQGKPRCEMSLGAGGLPSQVLRDAAGQVRVKLTVLADGAPALAMLDLRGQPRGVLCLEDDGSPRLDLIDSFGKLRVTLTMLEDGITALNLLDTAGNSRAALTVTHEGSPRLNLRDKNAKVRATLRVHDNGTPQLDLFDADGKSILESLFGSRQGAGSSPAVPVAKRPSEKILEVSQFHLRKIPLLASVALAARAARRILPLFRPVHDDHGKDLRKDVLQAALSTAERVAMGWEVTPDEAQHYGRLALREIDAPAVGSAAAGVVARAAFASAAALEGDAEKVVAEVYSVLSAAAGCVGISGSDANQYEAARQGMTDAAAADYTLLAELFLGEFPDAGEPLDLSEAGPLGPLWPLDPPEWYQRLVKAGTA